MAQELSFLITNVFCFYISPAVSTIEVPNAAVLCSSLMSCFLGMQLRYYLNDL